MDWLSRIVVLQYTKMKTFKKSQMKMGETIMVLVVFFILLMVGLSVYSKVKINKIKKEMQDINSMKSVEIANRVSQLPELQCSQTQCTGCSGAIDMIKLDEMTDNRTNGVIDSKSGFLSKNLVSYFPLFGRSYVKVSLGFPKSLGEEDYNVSSENPEWLLYNLSYPHRDVTVHPIFIPVNLYDAYTDRCDFGVMEVGYYEVSLN